MLGNAIRKRLHRLAAFLGISLVVAGTAVVLTGTPAQAAFVYQGTYRISSGSNCLEVHGNNTADGIPVILGPCDSGENQRWAIYRLTDQNNYQFTAYNGRQPLNKCMDGPDRFPGVTIYGCHGGRQQRWSLSINPAISQQIRQYGTSECIGSQLGPFLHEAIQQNCANAQSWRLIPA